MLHITDTIYLKPLSIEDSKPMFETIDNERDYLGEWLTFVPSTQEEQNVQVYIRAVLQTPNKQFTIYDGSTFLGTVGFNKHSDYENKRVEIGYWLSEKNQGKGIMTKAVELLVRMAFSEMDINRVQIRAGVENVKSRKIPESLGFKLEGIERDGELLSKGFTDLAVYSLLKKEFTI